MSRAGRVRVRVRWCVCACVRAGSVRDVKEVASAGGNELDLGPLVSEEYPA
jgi:hypothetical protein